jgi:ankyrin repeat protein
MTNLEAAITTGNVTEAQAAVAENPALLSSPTSQGVSPILMAVYFGQIRVAEALRDAKGGLDIFEASALGDQHEVDRLLALNPHAHREASADGFSPLGYSAYFGHRELLRDLLERGADPNALSQNDLRVSALHSALSGGHKEMARDLVQFDADVNVASAAEWTPLHYAAFSGDLETARFLIAHGASKAARNSDAKCPGDLARDGGFTDLAAELAPVDVKPIASPLG